MSAIPEGGVAIHNYMPRGEFSMRKEDAFRYFGLGNPDSTPYDYVDILVREYRDRFIENIRPRRTPGSPITPEDYDAFLETRGIPRVPQPWQNQVVIFDEKNSEELQIQATYEQARAVGRRRYSVRPDDDAGVVKVSSVDKSYVELKKYRLPREIFESVDIIPRGIKDPLISVFTWAGLLERQEERQFIASIRYGRRVDPPDNGGIRRLTAPNTL